MARIDAQLTGTKLHRLCLLLLLAGATAGLAAPPALANRGEPPTTVTTKPRPTTTTVTRPPNYVPAGTPGTPPTTLDVDFPEDFGRPFAGGPLPPGPMPVSRPPAPGPSIAGPSVREPDWTSEPGPLPSDLDADPAGKGRSRDSAGAEDTPTPRSLIGGILSRTGAETGPLVRAGLSALTLGVGLVLATRRRRADA